MTPELLDARAARTSVCAAAAAARGAAARVWRAAGGGGQRGRRARGGRRGEEGEEGERLRQEEEGEEAKAEARMVVIEEAGATLGADPRDGGRQAAGWAEWEEMLAAPPATPPSQLSTALHVFATTLAVVDLLEPNKLKAGVTLARDAATAAERLLPGIPINAFTWPEVLRMVIAAKNAGRAPKQREVAMRALLDAGIASAAIAHNATRQLGGSHTETGLGRRRRLRGASGGGEKEKEGEEDEGEEEGASSAGDWGEVSDALSAADGYDSLSVAARGGGRLHRSYVDGIFRRVPPPRGLRAIERLADLKRNTYKRRNAEIEAEEQAKLATKYSIDRPPHLPRSREAPRAPTATATVPLTTTTRRRRPRRVRRRRSRWRR